MEQKNTITDYINAVNSLFRQTAKTNRRRKGWNQCRTAEEIGVSEKTYQRYESKIDCVNESALRIIHALDFTPEQLLDIFVSDLFKTENQKLSNLEQTTGKALLIQKYFSMVQQIDDSTLCDLLCLLQNELSARLKSHRPVR